MLCSTLLLLFLQEASFFTWECHRVLLGPCVNLVGILKGLRSPLRTPYRTLCRSYGDLRSTLCALYGDHKGKDSR